MLPNKYFSSGAPSNGFARVAGIRVVAAVWMMVLFAGACWAQGSRKDDIVFNAQGRPMAGATVRICTSSATGQPCSPLASIYSDVAMTQALANPISADGLGNYTFYAAPGRYEVEISGPGITTKQMPNVVLPSDPSSPTFTTVTTTSGISAFSLSLAGNLTVSGSAAVTGTLLVGGAPVPSTGADNEWSGNQRFKGPTPWRDFTAYMQQGGVQIPGGCSSTIAAFDPTTTGTISSGSTSLTLSAAQDFKNGCDVSVIGAGPNSVLPSPQGGCTIGSIGETGGVVTVNCVSAHNIAGTGAQIGVGVVISGVGISGYNGTFSINSVTAGGATFTYNDPTTGLSASTGGMATLNWGYAHGATGSTTYNYRVAAVDSFGGVSAAGPTITIANGNSSLTNNNYNWIAYGPSASDLTFPNILYTRARMYLIYSDKGLGGALSCVGTSFTNGYSDFGLAYPCPPFAPATPPSSTRPQMLNATITNGAGTTTLTLSAAAVNSASSTNVYHDNTRFLKLCLSDAIADQGISGYGYGVGSFGCYVPAGNWAFNYQMPTDRVGATSPYSPANGAHILFAGSPQFATIPWIFTTGNWDIEGVGNSAPSNQFVGFPTTQISGGQHLPGMFVLEGGANNMEIHGFTASYLMGHGVWAGAPSPYNGGGINGLRLDRMQLTENTSGGAGAPIVFDANTIGVWMDRIFLGPNPAGLDSIYWTQTDYNDNPSAEFFISDVTSTSRGIKFDAPGGNGSGGGDSDVSIDHWVSENLVAASAEPGFIEHDNGPNAPGAIAPIIPLSGVSIKNLSSADAISGPSAYSVFVENGSASGFPGSDSVQISDGFGAMFSCSAGATACTNGPQPMGVMNIGSPFGGNFGGDITVNSLNFNVGVPFTQSLSTYSYGSNPMWWATEYPPFGSFQVTGSGSGSLSAGTYYMKLVGVDGQSTPGTTLPTPEISQTVGASASISMSWTEGNGDLGGTYAGGRRLYFGTSPGGESHYCPIPNSNSLTYTFTSTSCSGVTSGAPPTKATAYMSWMSADYSVSGGNSCLFCSGNLNKGIFKLGIGQPAPAEKLDVNGAINSNYYYRANETTSPTAASNEDFLWADSTDHRWKMTNNNGTPTDVAGVSDSVAPYDLDNVVYVDGTKYALSAAGIQAALVAGGQNCHVILPPGTISVSVEAQSIYVPDGCWVSGAGKSATTVQRASGGSSTHAIFFVGSGGSYGTNGNVVFSDFAIDGNRTNESGGGPNIVGGTISGLTVQRMRLVNSYADAVGAFPSGTGMATDVRIEDSDFVANVAGTGGGAYDVRIQQPLKVHILRNHFYNSNGVGTIGFSSNTGVGTVEVGENTLDGFTGFGIALGGGTNGGSSSAASGADIHDNILTTGSGASQNAIDIAEWSNANIHDNQLYLSAGGLTGISDNPPASKTLVHHNTIYAYAGNVNSVGIELGGPDTQITDNFVQGAGGSGIVYAITNAGAVANVNISGNTSKNNNQANPSSYTKAGIEVFLTSGGLAAVTDVTIANNRAYDDQGTTTQWYGVELANSGQQTGFSNITIDGNDVNGNHTAGIYNNTSGASNLAIYNNPGSSLSLAPPFCANSAACTPTSMVASGIVDGQTAVTVTTGTSITLGGTYSKTLVFNEEATAASAVTYTLPAAVQGKEYCTTNANNGSAPDTGAITIQTSASGQYIIFTDGTLSASGGYVQSGGAAADAACVVGVDSSHWFFYLQSGTWTKH